MKASLLNFGLMSILFGSHLTALKVATAPVIEFVPQSYAAKNFYKGDSPVSFFSGGVRNLPLNSTFELASNAETQGLLTYASHKNIRLIYIICQVAYRLVARRESGIKSLEDLKGKKIATMPSTSAQVFVDRLLGSVGLTSDDYTLVFNGTFCERAPCSNGSYPYLLASGQVDAFGLWEPAVELAIDALGTENAIIFQNASIYREVYSLYSTTEKLNDPNIRKNIVSYVRALNQSLAVFANRPKSAGIYQYVADQLHLDAATVEAVWPLHNWTGNWDPNLIELLVSEDAYLAQTYKRNATSKSDLERFLDDSIISEL